MGSSPYPEFADKVVLITGATSGIGRAAALAFAGQGAKVAISGRREREGEAVVAEIRAAGGRAAYFRGDVTVEEDVRTLVAGTAAAFGRVDIAVNNAGTEGIVRSITDETPENCRLVLNVNVLGVILCLKHEIAQMRKGGGGSIINIASVAGVIGVPKTPIYSASKHAVIGLTRSVALDVAGEGIRVNAVSPAATDTPMIDRIIRGDAATKQGLAGIHPVGRYAQTEDVVEAILYLSSARAGFITGHNLMVDGGRTAGVPLARKDMG